MMMMTALTLVLVLGKFCFSTFLFAVYIDDIAELFSLERGVVVYADDIILVTHWPAG